MTKATIGGFPILGSSPARWEIKDGVRPYIGEFDLIPGDAKQLIINAGNKQPIELFIDTGFSTPLRVKGLWPLNIYPGDNPHIMRVMVADVRWFWPYAHVLRRYNMHRHATVQRVTSNSRLELDPVVPRVQYWRWSVKTNQQKYNTSEVVLDIVRSACAKVHNGVPSITVDPSIGTKINNIPVEQLTIDDAGDQAVMRVMAYIPEGKIYPNSDGGIVISSKASGEEEGVVNSLGPEMVNRGHIEFVDNRVVRPSKIEVLFTREVEVRFDFNETAQAVVPGATVTRDEDPLGDRREMQNVLPLPDFQLQVNGGMAAQGTYVTMDEAFNGWGKILNPFNPSMGVKLDHPLVQKAFMPFNDLWSVLGLIGITNPNADWVSRLSAVQEHYRRTFRINSRWMDRIMSVRPYRVATIELISGQRAPAMAYCDYCILNTTRTIWKDKAAGQNLSYYINMTGYPANGVINDSTIPSAAKVSIPDSDQGIIHVDFLTDQFRVYEMMLPSNIIQNVTGDLTRRTDTVAFDAVIDPSMPLPRLSPSFKFATILSVIPASPNSIHQLHKVTIEPKDLKGLMPNDSALENAIGPVMQIRVGAGVETARVRWIDSAAGEIEKMFGVNVRPRCELHADCTGGTPDEEPPTFNIDNLVLNLGTPRDTISASLTNIAKAVACRVYASLIDRYQGQKTGNLTPGATPLGWADSILHEVATTGECTTKVALPDKIEQFSMLSFLDSSSRAVILKLVQP